MGCERRPRQRHPVQHPFQHTWSFRRVVVAVMVRMVASERAVAVAAWALRVDYGSLPVNGGGAAITGTRRTSVYGQEATL